MTLVSLDGCSSVIVSLIGFIYRDDQARCAIFPRGVKLIEFVKFGQYFLFDLEGHIKLTNFSLVCVDIRHAAMINPKSNPRHHHKKLRTDLHRAGTWHFPSLALNRNILMQLRAAMRKHGPYWHGIDFKLDLDLEDTPSELWKMALKKILPWWAEMVKVASSPGEDQ